MLYAVVLTIHSWLRWLVLLTGIVAFVRSAVGTSRRTAWTTADDRAGFWFSTVVDAQFLLGLVLYIFLSPFTHAAFRDGFRNERRTREDGRIRGGRPHAKFVVPLPRARVRIADDRPAGVPGIARYRYQLAGRP